MIYPTLYKRTSTGKVQTWFAEVSGDSYRTTSGQEDGKKTTTEWTVCMPKNVGRSNELTAEQQAVAEVQAMYAHKEARDYHTTSDNVDVQMRFNPMLAHKWKDRKDKIKGERIFTQPKLDGMRCIATIDGLWSREGKPIVSAPHIHYDLQRHFDANPDLVLDGELYNHDLKDDFNTIISACKKKKNPTAEQLAVSKDLIQYWVYDMPSHSGPFENRSAALQGLLCDEADTAIVTVETIEIQYDQVDEFAGKVIGEGFEGLMVRLNGKYENKRSNNLIKWKEMQDDEFVIVDIMAGTGNRSGMAASVTLQIEPGVLFSAGVIGNFDYCKKLLADKALHIGKKGTVIFQNLTPAGIPRFGKFKCVRDYE
jgi:DNA ligase-1